MDKRIIFGSVGSIIKYLGILMIVPLGVALWYGERPIRITLFIVQTWLIPLAMTVIFGFILRIN